MATELSGRAIDEAAARAMGWTTMQPEMAAVGVVGWLRPDGCIACLPAYSTDPARIDEMLAWLHEFGQVTIYSNPKATVADLASMNTSATGRTISEALARLVVAVKEAQQ